MYRAQIALKLQRIYLPSSYIYQMAAVMVSLLLLLVSNTASALASNPGATCQGVNGASQDSLTNGDYSSLISQVNTNNYVTVAGNAAGSIPLQIRMTTSETNGPPTSGSFDVETVGGTSAFNMFRDFPSTTSITSIDFDFRNSITAQPILLTNVAMSAFDIDFADISGFSFDDYVLFSGVTADGRTIDGDYQTIAGSNIRPFRETAPTRPTFPGLGLYTLNQNASTECPGTNLDTECQGSVQFSEPVRSVKVRYSNANYRVDRRNPSNQQMFFRVDNYCYVPQYIFSGIVFNDNGGIADSLADANNANITTGAYNNANYFNGVFNTPSESGIASSTVRLASCTNTATTYAIQAVAGSGATIGQYQFSVPISTFNNNTNICLIETRSGTTFPIRTNSDNINTGFSSTTYNYPSNNFGRVIAANAALVLKKFQFVNACPSNISYSTIATTNNPTTGFSTETIAGNITPGQCIAYRITATNRANSPINNFVMRDTLQTKGVSGALVTSVLANPVANTTDYASNSVAIGQNGTVVTNSFTLAPRSNRDFYFNTRYGTTQ